MSWNESKRKKCLLIFLVADIVLLLAFIVTCLPFNKKNFLPVHKDSTLECKQDS